jgi:ABC-type nitrate/sulfonate/bicarbonate transport system permease component
VNARRSMAGIVVVLFLLLAVWQGYIWVSNTPSYVLPTPGQTGHAISGHLSLLAGRAWTTLQGAALGLGAAVVLAVALAVLIVRWPWMEHVVLTYALLVRTLPIVGVAPIVTLVAGRGLSTSVLCVMVVTVFSLLIAVIQGFESVPAVVHELGDVYTAPFLRRVRVTLLPEAVGSLLQGLRVAAPLAVLGSLLAEWLDGYSGLGSLMVTAQADQEIELLMATAVTAVVLSLAAFALVEWMGAAAGRRGYRVDELAP